MVNCKNDGKMVSFDGVTAANTMYTYGERAGASTNKAKCASPNVVGEVKCDTTTASAATGGYTALTYYNGMSSNLQKAAVLSYCCGAPGGSVYPYFSQWPTGTSAAGILTSGSVAASVHTATPCTDSNLKTSGIDYDEQLMYGSTGSASISLGACVDINYSGQYYKMQSCNSTAAAPGTGMFMQEGYLDSACTPSQMFMSGLGSLMAKATCTSSGAGNSSVFKAMECTGTAPSSLAITASVGQEATLTTGLSCTVYAAIATDMKATVEAAAAPTGVTSTSYDHVETGLLDGASCTRRRLAKAARRLGSHEGAGGVASTVTYVFPVAQANTIRTAVSTLTGSGALSPSSVKTATETAFTANTALAGVNVTVAVTSSFTEPSPAPPSPSGTSGSGSTSGASSMFLGLGAGAAFLVAMLM
jgi:hypothetical protein